MVHLRIVLDAEQDPPLSGVDVKDIIHAQLDTVAALPGGMSSGRPSVALIGRTADGKAVLMEVSLRLFQSANVALEGRYGRE